MKVRKGSKPMKRVIPKDPANGIYEDKVHEWIGNVLVVDVDDLVEWCRSHPDERCEDLMHMLERGDFE